MGTLEFDGIRRSYRRGKPVLDGATFSVEAGQVVGLLGRNGAGKTTLVHIAMGMLESHGGTVSVLGMDPRQHPLEVKRRVGFVSEEQVLPEFLRVGDVIRLHRGLYPTWDEAMERDLARRFRIDLHRRIKTLSKGEARQVALLCAVAHRPEVLILDEPAGGLDPAVRREFLETSIQLLNESGSTILFSSHYMGDVERMANRVVMLHDGKVLLDHELDQLREEFTLALVPLGNGATRERLLRLEGCLAVRQRSDSMHVILQLDRERAEAVLAGAGEIRGATYRSIPLEEMFIELVGGRS